MKTEVVRSDRRKKTVQARVVDNVLRVHIPAHFDASLEAYWVETMRTRVLRARAAETVDLPGRASDLARRYGLPEPTSIVWSRRQKTLWASCTPSRAAIRVSERLVGFPTWVLDYVIVHELAHLEEPDHGWRFWELVNRYPRAERARGYLEAKADGCRHDGGDNSGDD